jgi:hypothetical protein
MEEEESHEARADELEREADDLEEGSDAVGDDVKELREDWDSKKKSEQTAGAVEHEAAMPGGTGEDEDSDDDSDEDDSDDDR